VPTEYFLKDKPTILFATIVQGTDPRVVVNACLQQAQALRRGATQLPLLRNYVVDFAGVPSKEYGAHQYLVTWTRIAEGMEPPAAWEEFERRLSALHAGELSQPAEPVPAPARP